MVKQLLKPLRGLGFTEGSKLHFEEIYVKNPESGDFDKAVKWGCKKPEEKEWKWVTMTVGHGDLLKFLEVVQSKKVIIHIEKNDVKVEKESGKILSVSQ